MVAGQRGTTRVDEIDRSIREGGRTTLGEVFAQIRDRLLRMVEFRLDRRLGGRVEPEDIVQEAFIEIDRRLDEYLADPRVCFFVWVRQITFQTVIAVQRRHFGLKRSPQKEVRYAAANDHSRAAYSIARQLIGEVTSPSQIAIREERIVQLRAALDSMDEIDREVLAMRHFEHLTNTEVAEVLDISKTAASNRYVRALGRLGEILSNMQEFNEL